MHHLYIQLHSDTPALQKEREALIAWCDENDVEDYDFIEDNLMMGRIPDKAIKSLLEPIHQGDTIVVSQMSRLGRSLLMLQTVMNHIRNKECTIICLEGRTMEPNRTMTLFVNSLNEIVEIERQMKAFRNNDVIYAQREEGLSLGRPLGARKKPEKNVLFGKTERLVSLYAEGLPLSRIALQLGVSRGTVSNYLKDIGLYKNGGR